MRNLDFRFARPTGPIAILILKKIIVLAFVVRHVWTRRKMESFGATVRTVRTMCSSANSASPIRTNSAVRVFCVFCLVQFNAAVVNPLLTSAGDGPDLIPENAIGLLCAENPALHADISKQDKSCPADIRDNIDNR